MKNKNMLYIIIAMSCLLIVVLFFLIKYSTTTIDEDLLNSKWYHYNSTNGYYDVFELSNNNLNYYKAQNTNDSSEFDNCKIYKYNKIKNVLTLDCGKKIKIISYNNEKLTLELDNKTMDFFKNIDLSLNYEFEFTYGKSMIDYKNEKSQILETIRIKEQKLLEVIKENEYSKLVFIGDKCTSVDCVLALDIIEKNNTQTNNIYYFDYSNLTPKLLSTLNKIDNKFVNSVDFYNNIYPRIILTKNNKIVDTYELKCNGFNCEQYYINEF